MRLERYMQPIAVHRTHAERLLLHDDQGNWYLWSGEAGADPIEIPQMLGHYLMIRRELDVLAPHQRMWFVVDDLPVRADIATANPERPEREHFV